MVGEGGVEVDVEALQAEAEKAAAVAEPANNQSDNESDNESERTLAALVRMPLACSTRPWLRMPPTGSTRPWYAASGMQTLGGVRTRTHNLVSLRILLHNDAD